MKTILIILSFLILTACSPNEADYKSDVTPESHPESGLSFTSPDSTKLPTQINLEVPFYPQAPDADWNLPWQEACEEASVVLASHYLSGKPLDKEAFKQNILNLVEWQKEEFGDYEHTTVSQTLEMLQQSQISNLRSEIIENPTIDDLKVELASGNLIIAPFAGRELGNPFYSGEGPYYHMLVIKGYDEEHFITNDVGTKRGENFIYPYQTIMSAMHDWHDQDIIRGAKKVIIVRPAEL